MTQDHEDPSATINAFVDGELSPDARAEVAARAARDPAFAHELAIVTRLKATLGAAVPAPDIALPKAATRPSRRVMLGLAAGLLLLIAAGAGWFLAAPGDGGALNARIDWAVALHQGWSATEPVGRSNSVAIPASLPMTPHVPDLSPNGLELVHAATAETRSGMPALVLGYYGSRGCRLTMVVVKAPDMMDERLSLDHAGMRASLWQAGELAYFLLAEGMRPARFRLVADSVHRATLDRTPLGSETRLALARSRAESPPCAA